MKLAELLLNRSDIEKQIETVRERIRVNTRIQDGDEPSEDPVKLLHRLRGLFNELEKTINRINRANMENLTVKNRSVSAALAEREVLAKRHRVISGITWSAISRPEATSSSDIRWITILNVESMQNEVEVLAKRLREVNLEIQAANWAIEPAE